MFHRLSVLLLVAFLPFVGCEHPEIPALPASYLLSDSALPAYEQTLDHARLIGDWSEEFYHRGMVTYRNNCYSCHGDPEQAGSIPNSRQFWKEPFKNGSDPYALYQTLTRGFGTMPPQVQLTPQEKYDVILFIREEFLREHNPDQYFEVTRRWMRSLPEGDSLGPEPQPHRPWAEMDYGRFLMRTYELADADDPPKQISRGPSPLANEDYRHLNFAYKGIAMRLDSGPGGVAASSKQIENPIPPGWANPETNSFADPRFVAVDGRPFGPLPREWAHYKGLYVHGDRMIIRYTVDDADVFET